MKKVLQLFVLMALFGCNNDDDSGPQAPIIIAPANISEMMAASNLSWNQTYTFREKSATSENGPYNETGVNGTVKFVQPNVVIENYEGEEYQSTFEMSNFSRDASRVSCGFSCAGYHNTDGSFFIDDVGGTFVFQNNERSINSATNFGGSYVGRKVIIE